MEQIAGYWYFIFFLMAMVVIFWYIFKYGKEQLAREKEYDRLYFSIQNDIDILDLTLENYISILEKIICLKRLKWRNKEKTDVLENKFLRKFTTRDRDIYEHSLTEKELDMWLRKQALRRKLNRIEAEDLRKSEENNNLQEMQPGETPTDLDLDYQNESGR
jgi:hypothetical protein